MSCIESQVIYLGLAWFWLIFSAFFTFYSMIYRKKQVCLMHLIILCLTGARILIGGYVITCSLRNENAVWFWVCYAFELMIELFYFMGGVSIIYFFSYGLGFFDIDSRASNDYSIILVFAPGYAVGILLKAFPLIGLPMASGYLIVLSTILTKNIQRSLQILQNEEQTLTPVVRQKVLKRFKTLSFIYCHVLSILYFIFTVLKFKDKSTQTLMVSLSIMEAFLLIVIIWAIRPQKIPIFTQDMLFGYPESGLIRIIFMKTDLKSSGGDILDQGTAVVYPGLPEVVGFAQPII